jgi:hypothetical protein
LLGRLQAHETLLKLFATATDIVQRNAATIWDAAAALQVLLEFAGNEGAAARAVRASLQQRARLICNPALMVLASLAPQSNPADPRPFFRRLLASAMPHAFAMVAQEFRPVRREALDISHVEFIEAMPSGPIHELAMRAIFAAPSEASVERVFSAMKCNVPRLRTRLHSRNATLQVRSLNLEEFLAAEEQGWGAKAARIRTQHGIGFLLKESARTPKSSAHVGPIGARDEAPPAAAAAAAPAPRVGYGGRIIHAPARLDIA